MVEKLKNELISMKQERDNIKKNAKSAVTAFDKQIVNLQEEHMKAVELSRKDKEYITKIFKTQYKKIEDSNNNVVVLTATLTIILFMVPLLTKSTK